MGSHAPSLTFFVYFDPLTLAHVYEKTVPHSSKSVTVCQLAVNHNKYGSQKILAIFRPGTRFRKFLEQTPDKIRARKY